MTRPTNLGKTYPRTTSLGPVTVGIGDLDDLDLSGIADGDIIIWDASSETWIVGPQTGGGDFVTVTDGGGEVISTVAASGSTETIDLADGNVHDITLTADCTFTFTSPAAGRARSFTLFLREDGTGGHANDTVWPGSVVWAGGSAPTLDDAASAVNVLTFVTLDGGSIWYGFVAGGTPTGGSGDVATDTIWDAKGDLAAGTGADTAAKLTVGANDTILMADSGQTTGLKWVASQTPSTQNYSDVAAQGTADTYARGDHVHGMPAAGAIDYAETGDLLPVGLVAAGGVSTEVTRADHVHEIDRSLSEIAATGSTETLDATVAQVHDLTLTANCTITLTGAVDGESTWLTLLLRQDDAGSRMVTWPASVEWPGNVAPTLTTDPFYVDIVRLLTVDGGGTWFGIIEGQDYQQVDPTPPAPGSHWPMLALSSS